MKAPASILSLLSIAAVASALAQSVPAGTNEPPVTTAPTAIVGFGSSLSATATISMGRAIMTGTLVPLPPSNPFTMIRGTHLQLVLPASALTNPVVTWYKNGARLSAVGPTLDIPAATPDDSGSYWVSAYSADTPSNTYNSEAVRILISEPGQQLLNVSTRARVDASQPFFLTGFVVQPGPGQTLVLVRAVGPTLASLGVVNPLAAPQLKVTDASGKEYAASQPWTASPVPSVFTSSDLAAARVGAFPLPSGSKDVAQLYLLGPGTYTAQVSSADGGTGTALLEVYQVPF